MSTIKKVGLLGLGKMGEPMARHLLSKGFDVIGYDPVEAACEKTRSHGARIVASA